MYSYFILWLGLPSCVLTLITSTLYVSDLLIYLVTSCIYIFFDAVYFILGILRMQDIYYTVYFYSTCLHLHHMYIFKSLYFQTLRVWQGFIGICSRINLTVLQTACRTVDCLLACVQRCSPCGSLRLTGQGEIFHINYMRKTGASRTWFSHLMLPN